MNLLKLPYGIHQLEFDLPFPFDLFDQAEFDPPAGPDSLIQNALCNPLDTPWEDLSYTPRTVAISINDKTRPVPYALLLPPLLDWLSHFGISDGNIKLFIATGTHSPATSEEIEKIIPSSILNRSDIQVYSHDCDDKDNLKFLGITQRGTPVWVNKHFYESDLRIVTGNIEPHHFMGFSGGAKSAAIGLAGRETINHNHAMLDHPHAVMGEYEHNPMRQDVEEIGRMMDIHLAFNLILNANREIIAALFGSPIQVMQKGIQISCELWAVKPTGLYDLVIASPGGYPKDINLYQAQKAISHAALFAKEGGVIILTAACPEGIGSPKALQFAEQLSTPDETIKLFKSMDFTIGPHKAYQLALQAKRNKIFLVSEIDDDVVTKFFLQPAKTLQHALHLAKEFLPKDFRTVVLPHATALFPKFAPRE